MGNKTIGLSLSGGGYRGLAHVGVLQFLEEEKIVPSEISGTSAGSIVSCLYALGMPPKEILDFFKSVNLFSWSHFTLTKAGLMDVEAFDKYLSDVFKDKKLKHLNIPVYITATNIAKGTLHVFDQETSVVSAILASSAFPGIFSPYKIDNSLYSDGGIMNNFPTNLLQKTSDYIIGVNVCPIQSIEQTQLTSIRAVTIRAYELMTAINTLQQGALCDWIIEPKNLANYSTFERNKLRMNEIYEIGYQGAKESYVIIEDKFKKAIL